jgi:hypothetical protein
MWWWIHFGGRCSQSSDRRGARKHRILRLHLRGRRSQWGVSAVINLRLRGRLNRDGLPGRSSGLFPANYQRSNPVGEAVTDLICQFVPAETPPGKMQRWTCPACGVSRISSKEPRNRICGPDVQKPEPGLVQKALNLGRTAIAVAADGAVQCTARQLAERRSICTGCSMYNSKTDSCAKCGCSLQFKPLMRASTCPLNKWPVLTEETLTVAPFDGPITRNLLMFLCPLPGPEWRRNLEQVKRRMELFNGKRIIGVVTGGLCDPFEEVATELEGLHCELIPFENNRLLGELVGFKTLLEKVESTAANEITYYCHAKGVGKQHTDQIGPIRKWADAMHEILLDGIADVETALNRKVFAGAFRDQGSEFPSGLKPDFDWHYPGTFYWFRNQPVFSGNRWRDIPRQLWGAEAWPGIVCPLSQSSCLLWDKVPVGSLYSTHTFQMYVQPYLDQWRLRQRKAIREDIIGDNV